MGVPRICNRCFVPLVTNHTHTRIWCPRCNRQIRLRDHSDKTNGPHTQPQPAATSGPPVSATTPPPSPPPCLQRASSARTEEAAPLIIAAHVPVPRRRHELPILLLLLVGLIGGGAALVVYLSILQKSDHGTQVAEQSNHNSPVTVRATQTTPTNAQRAPTPPPPTFEKYQEKLHRGIFEAPGPLPVPHARVTEGTRRIDELVRVRLKEAGIAPAALCSDAVFVRRVYLDVIGRIPTAEEAKQFLDDKTAERRVVLIDRLLAHPDFTDYWTMKWCDLLRVKSEFPINLWPNAVQAYHRWLRTAIQENRPYDEFARELLTASGSNFRDPPANFYRAVQKKDASNLARAVALTFMGVRPEGWPREKWAGMEPFFSQVGYKRTGEWKEEVVFFDFTRPLATEAALFPDGTKAAFDADQDPREVFADWLIQPDNPWFTRNIANRVWSWLLGRGIIHEVDDVRPDNPPSNPELLVHLEHELIRAKYDLRQLFRVILNSQTYQASSIPVGEHPEASTLFAYYPVRRLEAEVLIDAICQITGTTEQYSSPIPEPFTYIPESHRSVSLADASITSPFLELFGRSARDTGLESERNNNFTPAQRLHLLNSAHIMKKIEQGPKLQQIIQAGGKLEENADRLYLTILGRYPTKDEKAGLSEYSAGGGGRRPILDVAWALMNTAEFLCRH